MHSLELLPTTPTDQPELFAPGEVTRLVTVPPEGAPLGEVMRALGLEWDEVRPCFGQVLYHGRHYVRARDGDRLLAEGVRVLGNWFERPCRIVAAVEMEGVC